ncbi:MAG: acyl-CoA dehydrogenase family protein [Verrucomicrobia bacterium]|nr:acyl-CoA dehydrogenase family protein [Verrucomicrobiota bacterium]
MANKNRLQQERESNPLPMDRLKILLNSSENRKKAQEILLKHPELIDTDFTAYDITRAEIRKKTFEKVVLFNKLSREIKDPDLITALFNTLLEADPQFGTRILVHQGLFVGAIKTQGTQEQIEYYVPKTDTFEIYGCFCMTELGKGSYLQSLETTAIYDKNTDEFLIHTPTLTATKWWIGGAAQTATHTIVIAKLILNGEDLGPHNFIVQLRDQNFDLLPGITLGDIGPKRGQEGVDNAWVRFDQVRIPRTQMLMKWSQVTPEGKYIKSQFIQLAYATLIPSRVEIASHIVKFVKRAVTIASRYSIVRDQYSMKGKCLLDYTTQQERLISALCACYAYDFGGQRLAKYLQQVNRELEKKEIKNLKDLHNQVAAQKGFSALWANQTINDCILCLGGHSYSKLSGLPSILNDFAPNIPWEGDAIVLVQQTAHYLIKAIESQNLEGHSIQYLAKISDLPSMKCQCAAEQHLSLKDLVDASEWLALRLIQESVHDLQKNSDPNEAWNACQLKVIQAAKAHHMHLLIESFTQENDLPTLTHMAELFALQHLQEFMSIFYENNYFPTTRGPLLREQILEKYRAIRPYVAPLVDAWDLPDFVLKSPLGRYDGDIYENYFKAVNSLPQDIKPNYWKEKN